MNQPEVITTESGFSAIELLITLFIAVAFIATGYQLYSAIIGDGGLARSRAIASNVAYLIVRQTADRTDIPCSTTPVTVAPINAPDTTGLDTPIITTTVSAPYGCNGGAWTDTIMLIQTVVTYGPANPTPRPEVTHAIYANK